MTLDQLAKLEAEATKGWKYTLEGDIRNDADGLVADFVPFSGDGKLAVAARNHLPALIRVAKAAKAIYERTCQDKAALWGINEPWPPDPCFDSLASALKELEEVKNA